MKFPDFSLTFPWPKFIFPDHFTMRSRPPPPLTAVCYAPVLLILTTIKLYPYIRNMCLNKKKRQTTGSKRVRKEHYIHFCCIRWFVKMLFCLPELLASYFQRIFPAFLNMSLWEQMTPGHGQFGPQGHGWPGWLARFMQGITKHWYYIYITY